LTHAAGEADIKSLRLGKQTTGQRRWIILQTFGY